MALQPLSMGMLLLMFVLFPDIFSNLEESGTNWNLSCL